jgi:hypothetical protein
MMMKSGLQKIILKFHGGLQTRPIQPFWEDFFALGSSNSKGHRGISKYFFLDHFSSPFLSQKWCQISVRILCVLSGTRNLQ